MTFSRDLMSINFNLTTKFSKCQSHLDWWRGTNSNVDLTRDINEALVI